MIKELFSWMLTGLTGVWCICNIFSLICRKITGRSEKEISWITRWIPPFFFLLVLIFIGVEELFLMTLAIFGLNTFCVILNTKRTEKMRWSEMLVHFFAAFQWLRKKIQTMRKLISYKQCFPLIFAAATATLLFLSMISAKAAAVFAIIMLFAGTLFAGTGSVRYLLLFWLLAFIAMLCYGIVFAEELMRTGAESSFTGIFAAAAGTTILWCISIGISEHDVGKLAAGIINTMTTCILIVLSVLGAYRTAGAGLWGFLQKGELFQLICLNGVLPFVIAGYIAALFKEMQIYIEKKYMMEDFAEK